MERWLKRANYPGCNCPCCLIEDYVCDPSNSALGPMDCPFLFKSGYDCDTDLSELVEEGFCRAGTNTRDENNEDLSIASVCPRFCEGSGYVCDGPNSAMDCALLFKSSSNLQCETTLSDLVAEGFCKTGTKTQDENNADLSIASFCPRFCEGYRERSVKMLTEVPEGSGDYLCQEIKLDDCDMTLNSYLGQGWDEGSCQDAFGVEDADEMFNHYHCESLNDEGTALCLHDTGNYYVEEKPTIMAFVTNKDLCPTTNAEALGMVEGVSSNGVPMEQAVLYMFAAVGVSSAVYAVRELICKKTPYDVVGEVEI